MSRSPLIAVTLRRRAVGGAMATLLLLGLLLLALAADSMLSMMATAAPAPAPNKTTAAGERYAVSGDQVAVYNLAGEARIEAGKGPGVEVFVERGGDDAAQLKIESGVIRGKQTLRVIYPSNHIVYPSLGRWSSSNLRVDDDGTFNDRKDGWSGAEKVTISGHGSGLEAHADLRITVPTGQKIDVYLGVGGATVSNVNGRLKVSAASASIASNGTRGSLLLDTGSGDIHVDGAAGEVSLDTGSGEVEVSDVSGGHLHVDTGSGSIVGSGLKVDDLSMDTGSGSIRLNAVTAPSVMLDTGSGSVDVSLTGDVDELAIDTGSGDVTVRVPKDLGAELSVETGSGGIDTEFPVQLLHHSRDSMRGRIGDGKGHIVVETGSGSVRLANYEGKR